MLLKIHPENPPPRLIQKAVDVLNNDGVIIYPTDTVYGLGCNILSKKAVEKLRRIRKLDAKKPLSLICSSENEIQTYSSGISNRIFKIMRKTLPGPYTFIFEASKESPKNILDKRKKIGCRFPNHLIATDLVKYLGNPMLSVSLKTSDDSLYNNPEELYEEYQNQVDLVIDGGIIFAEHSTIVDFTEHSPILLREGKGISELQELLNY